VSGDARAAARRAGRVALEPERQPSMAELLTGLLDDARHLVRKEVELAREELRLEARRLRGAATVMAVAAALLLLAAMGFAAAAGLGLAAAGLPAWGAALVVAAVLAVAGGFALHHGRGRLRARPGPG
jgi:hypothetical protein